MVLEGRRPEPVIGRLDPRVDLAVLALEQAVVFQVALDQERAEVLDRFVGIMPLHDGVRGVTSQCTHHPPRCPLWVISRHNVTPISESALHP